MTVDEPNAPNDSDRNLDPLKREPVDYGLILFLVLAVLAIALPHVSLLFLGVYWAALIAIAIFLAWVSVMPTSCINGGFGYSLVAMAILFNTIGMALLAALRFVATLIW